MIEIILTSNQIWTVPNDWSSVNTIEIIGGGGGAGGGYVKVENVNILQPKQQINVIVGQGGAAADEWFMPSLLSSPLYLSTILRVTGFHYHPTLFSTGTTTFGSYMSVFGGRYQSESFFDKMFSHIGGNLNFNSWPLGSYTNLVTSQGESKRYLGFIGDGDPRVDTFDPISFGGAAGGPGFLNYGRGGQAQTLVNNYIVWGNRFGTTGGIDPAQVTKPALSGTQGVVRITYEPSGTQQACVWIS